VQLTRLASTPCEGERRRAPYEATLTEPTASTGQEIDLLGDYRARAHGFRTDPPIENGLWTGFVWFLLEKHEGGVLRLSRDVRAHAGVVVDAIVQEEERAAPRSDHGGHSGRCVGDLPLGLAGVASADPSEKGHFVRGSIALDGERERHGARGVRDRRIDGWRVDSERIATDYEYPRGPEHRNGRPERHHRGIAAFFTNRRRERAIRAATRASKPAKPPNVAAAPRLGGHEAAHPP